MSQENSFVSPRITLLEQALLAENAVALDAFWQEIAEYGAPLIEPIEGDETHSLVTFLWRGSEDTKNVVVFAGPADWREPAKNQIAGKMVSSWHGSLQSAYA